MQRIKIAVVVTALVVAPTGRAQTFIVPESDCGSVTLRVTDSSDFSSRGWTIAPADVAVAYVHLPKRRVTVAPVATAREFTFNTTVPDDTTVVMASVTLKSTLHGNETRTEHAKAFVFCGAVTPPADWQRSTGLGLEIYPQGWNGPRPQLKPGDTMRFIVVDKGTNQLLGDLPMYLYGADGRRIAEGVQAQGGGMNFPYQEPGRYMIVTTHRRPDPQQPGHWLVDNSTLTFDIK